MKPIISFGEIVQHQIKNEVIEPSAFNHQHHLFLLAISKGLGFTG